MSILFVIHTPRDPCTAVYSIYSQLAEYLREHGRKVTILAPEDFPGLRRWHGRWLPLLYPFWVARWLMQREHADSLALFHSYAGWVVNLLRRTSPPYRRLRTVTASHGLEPLAYDELEREMDLLGHPLRLRFRLVHGFLIPRLIRMSCRRSDRIVCPTFEEAEYLVEHKWSDGSRVTVIPHGVPKEFFTPRHHWDAVQRLLFVGQWTPRKGTHYLVKAFNAVARDQPRLQLWCVGTLLEEERVLADFPLEIRNQVIVRPRVPREQLPEIYRDADLFIFPSLFEGFGLALLEAMAAALPIVTTPTGAGSSLLEDEATALVIPKRDPAALTDSIRRLQNDRILRKRLAHAAQARATQYSLELVHQQYLAFLKQV